MLDDSRGCAQARSAQHRLSGHREVAHLPTRLGQPQPLLSALPHKAVLAVNDASSSKQRLPDPEVQADMGSHNEMANKDKPRVAPAKLLA